MSSHDSVAVPAPTSAEEEIDGSLESAGKQRVDEDGPAEAGSKSSSFWKDPPWWIRDGILALLITIIVSATTVWVQKDIDDQRFEREKDAAQLLAQQSADSDARQAQQSQRLENQRFVREKSSQEYVSRPFQRLDLSGLDLAGLSLKGADFRLADLRGANFSNTELSGADLSAAQVDHSTNFFGADLQGAYLGNLDGELRLDRTQTYGARMEKVKIASITPYFSLENTFLHGADLRLVDRSDLQSHLVAGACFNDETLWPDGYEPPGRGDDSECIKTWEDVFFSTPKSNYWGLWPTQ